MANSSKDRLRNLNRSNIINLPFNEVLELAISSTDLPCYSQLAGILRFCNNEYTINSPRYKMVVLMDDTVYCYGKIYRDKILDLNYYSSSIKFKSDHIANAAWNEVMGTPIIKYGSL